MFLGTSTCERPPFFVQYRILLGSNDQTNLKRPKTYLLLQFMFTLILHRPTGKLNSPHYDILETALKRQDEFFLSALAQDRCKTCYR